MSEFGGSNVKSAVCFCAASLFRSSYSTITGWMAQLEQLRAAQQEFLPASRRTSPNLARPCWDAPPFVLHLSRASLWQFLQIPGCLFDPPLLLNIRQCSDHAHRVQRLAYQAFLPSQAHTQWSNFVLRGLAVVADIDGPQLDHIDLGSTSAARYPDARHILVIGVLMNMEPGRDNEAMDLVINYISGLPAGKAPVILGYAMRRHPPWCCLTTASINAPKVLQALVCRIWSLSCISYVYSIRLGRCTICVHMRPCRQQHLDPLCVRPRSSSQHIGDRGHSPEHPQHKFRFI